MVPVFHCITLIKAHFESLHAKIGITTTVSAIAVAIYGYVIRTYKLRIGIDRVKQLFVLHKVAGYVVLTKYDSIIKV